MNIKQQILFILLFLFGVTIIITGVSAYYSNRNSNLSDAILKDNYNSIIYTKDMLKSISVIGDSNSTDFGVFENSLKLQQNNITEKGEKELTDSISAQFNRLKNDLHPAVLISSITGNLFKVMELNMDALKGKSVEANQFAKQFFSYFLVSLILFVIIALYLAVKPFNNSVKVEAKEQ